MARKKGGQSAVTEDDPPEPTIDHGRLLRRSTRLAQNESKHTAEMARNCSSTNDVDDGDPFRSSSTVALTVGEGKRSKVTRKATKKTGTQGSDKRDGVTGTENSGEDEESCAENESSTSILTPLSEKSPSIIVPHISRNLTHRRSISSPSSRFPVVRFATQVDVNDTMRLHDEFHLNPGNFSTPSRKTAFVPDGEGEDVGAEEPSSLSLSALSILTPGMGGYDYLQSETYASAADREGDTLVSDGEKEDDELEEVSSGEEDLLYKSSGGNADEEGNSGVREEPVDCGHGDEEEVINDLIASLDDGATDLRRSPRSVVSEFTMVSDLMSGLKTGKNFSVEERAKIAIKLQDRLLAVRHRDLQKQLTDLMGDPMVAAHVSERTAQETSPKKPTTEKKRQQNKVSKQGKGSGKEPSRADENTGVPTRKPVDLAVQLTFPTLQTQRDRYRAPIPSPNPMPVFRDLTKVANNERSRFAEAIARYRAGQLITHSREEVSDEHSQEPRNAAPANKTLGSRRPDDSAVDITSAHFSKNKVPRPPKAPFVPQYPSDKHTSKNGAPEGSSVDPEDQQTSRADNSNNKMRTKQRSSSKKARSTGKEVEHPPASTEAQQLAGKSHATREQGSRRKGDDGQGQQSTPAVHFTDKAVPTHTKSGGRKKTVNVENSRSHDERRRMDTHSNHTHTKKGNGKVSSQAGSKSSALRASQGDATGKRGETDGPSKRVAEASRKRKHAEASGSQGNATTETFAPSPDDELWEPLPTAQFDDDLLGNDIDVGRSMKRRKGKRNADAPGAKGKTDGPHEEPETFDIHGEDSEGGGAPEMPHQLRHYKGTQKDLMNRARSNMHIYLLTINAFPTPEDLTKWCQLAYMHAVTFIYGEKHEHNAPQFDNGIRKLLSNEAWSLRGKVKRDVARLVTKFYPIYPARGAFNEYPNPTVTTKRFIKQRVDVLLGVTNKEAMYLYGGLEPGGKLQPYAHPAIRELVHKVVFSRSHRMPPAAIDLKPFSPLPIPLIVFVCTALVNGLEEFSSGEQITKEFSTKDYAEYYMGMVHNLERMDRKKDSRPILAKIRQRIFESGRKLLLGTRSGNGNHPPYPQFSSSEEEADAPHAGHAPGYHREEDLSARSRSSEDIDSEDLDHDVHSKRARVTASTTKKRKNHVNESSYDSQDEIERSSPPVHVKKKSRQAAKPQETWRNESPEFNEVDEGAQHVEYSGSDSVSEESQGSEADENQTVDDEDSSRSRSRSPGYSQSAFI